MECTEWREERAEDEEDDCVSMMSLGSKIKATLFLLFCVSILRAAAQRCTYERSPGRRHAKCGCKWRCARGFGPTSAAPVAFPRRSTTTRIGLQEARDVSVNNEIRPLVYSYS